MHLLDLEEKEQIERYSLNEQNNLKSLKKDGLAIHPIRISRKSFGYAEYPEISFFIPFPCESAQFRDGCAIECFSLHENETIKGILLQFNGKQGEFRLFTHDFPDWIEDDGVGIRLAPDTRTIDAMRKGLKDIETSPRLTKLFNQIHDISNQQGTDLSEKKTETFTFFNTRLNESQQMAVEGM